MFFFFFSSRRRHTRCALVTGVQTCALPIWARLRDRLWRRLADHRCDHGVRADDGGTVAHLARRLLAGLARPARPPLGDPLPGASRLADRPRHPHPVPRAAGAGDALVVVDDLAGLYPGVALPGRSGHPGPPRTSPP